MVSEFDSGLSGLSRPNPGQDIELCFWARHFTLMVSLHPGVSLGTGKFNAGGNPVID